MAAQDITGRKFTLTVSDFAARVFQHEYDHLQVCADAIFDVFCVEGKDSRGMREGGGGGCMPVGMEFN